MTKDELLRQLAENRAQWNALIESLSTEELIRPDACGYWSVKDVLVHISRWEAEAIKALFQADQNATPDCEYFNADYLKVNEVWYQESKDRELERVLADYHAVRKQLVQRLTAFPEPELTDPARYPWMNHHGLIVLVKEIALDHEVDHLQGLKSWRTALSA